MHTKKTFWILCSINIMLLSALSSIAFSTEEEKLLSLVQNACSGYFSVNNLNLSVKEIQQRAKHRKDVIEKVMTYALNADNLKNPKPLLRHMRKVFDSIYGITLLLIKKIFLKKTIN